jgi:bifunctional aspartokinase / homoserine dehydrogenase 1
MSAPVRALDPLHVHKFGGAALADAAAMLRAAEIVQVRREVPSVVVASALAGVTDALVALVHHAREGDAQAVGESLGTLRERHWRVLRELLASSASSAAGESPLLETEEHCLDASFRSLAGELASITDARQASPFQTDSVLSYGERLSARFLTAALTNIGLLSHLVDATDVLLTDGRHGNAAPDLARTTTAARERLVPLLQQGVIVVLPGFIGAGGDRANDVVTLGRGGSDLTATVLARALGAREVHLWKDVPGILTADPRVVPTARVVAQLTVREAAELAYYGAKVLHPRALTPVVEGMRVVVRPFANPESEGSVITVRASSGGSPVRALSAIQEQAIVTVSGNGMIGVPGIAARTFGALAKAGTSVSLISQASSEHSICFAVPDGEAPAARDHLLQAFSEELARGEIDGVEIERGLATLAVVGCGMVHTPGVAARICGALADADINIVAIAQGSSELNVSVVVDGTRAGDAQRAIHDAFQLDKRSGGRIRRSERADVVLLGFGRIGRELASHVAASPELRSRLRIVGIIDRQGYLFDERGLSERRLATAALAKTRGAGVHTLPNGVRGTVREALEHITAHALARPILADLAAGNTHADLMFAIEHGMDAVLANKVPLTVSQPDADELFDRAQALGRRVAFEATVGAGLPIIDTHEKLVSSGDRVLSIEGCPSGTLGYLFGALGGGRLFSEAVRDAMALGYTEPDPRDDLSGLDVGRKGLILGRLLGFEGELEDVAIESLVPPELREVSLDEFLARMNTLDEPWNRRVDEARERSQVWRYRAFATARSVRVGLVAVPSASPLGSLVGTDNQFTFTTKRYRENPLIITGPGAGPAVTAAGVLNDLLKVAERRETRRLRAAHREAISK